MITDRNKCNFVTICCCMCFLASGWTIISASAIQTPTAKDESNAIVAPENATAHDFKNPRVEYNNNEWRPVGRGDPLKNDPTYDYSPPTLDRVRYWAEGNDKDGKKKDAENATSVRRTHISNSKTEFRGSVAASGERVRGSVSNGLYVPKNAKGETPLLQPKYPPIRRSYYSNQLPTHLMPPPMQSASGPQMMKPATTEYRHTIQHNYLTNAPTMGMSSSVGSGSYSKSHYPTTSSAPWMHSTPTYHQQQYSTHRTSASAPHPEPHHQETMHYFSYSRPESYVTHSATAGSTYTHTYSPNSIRPHQNAVKHNSAPRKPWLHELLQKEVIKPAKSTPTSTATQYFGGSTKAHYEFAPSVGISTTYAPLTYMSSTTTPLRHPSPATYASSTIYITPPSATVATSTTRPHVTFPTSTHYSTYATTTRGTTSAPSTPSTLSPNRLLIPNTSNLPNRPTVAPMELTTDALFKHYKQPNKLIRGPMYLIIEGHSKVKKYGKNEIDPHQPKIVPIIPKLEPVVRLADPSERYRGTPESFQVKHLHTVTTPVTTTTTTTPTTTTTTTPKPTSPAASKKKDKLAIATTMKTTTIYNPKTTSTSNKGALLKPNAVDPAPPAGEPSNAMQGFLNLLGGLLEEAPTTAAAAATAADNKMIYVTTQRTILKPVLTTAIPNLKLEARIDNSADTIQNVHEDDEFVLRTTIPPPREVRQVFDYDQLPESRLKELMLADSLEEFSDASWAAYEDEEDDAAETEAAAEAQALAAGYAHKTAPQKSQKHTAEYAVEDEDEDEAQGQQLIKRIDQLVGDVEEEELEEDTLAELAELDDYDEENVDLRRAQAKTA